MNFPEALRAALPPIERIIETHISWVALAGAFAWKVKKPVTLPFLDYGTLEQRRACCREELRLNRRFAPDVYLDVVDLGGEPAVKMRRFDEAARLDHVAAHGDLTGAQLKTFARELAAFQAGAVRSVSTPAQNFGEPAAILADALENFDELERLLPDAIAPLAQLKRWTRAEFEQHQADFARRHAQGFIREGHGDLHLANLVLLDDRIVPFDGIEFNAALRHIDVASEIAFTLLDLLDHRRPGLASWLLSEWLAYSGDFAALAVLRFYLVYRAMVRAKVAALQQRRDESLDYLRLALRLSHPVPPTLTITCGPSGSGKTWQSSRRLASADFLQSIRVRSDVERKRLFGIAPEDASGGHIYSAAATQQTYARLGEIAELSLQAGWSVIVDAAFLKRDERAAFAQLAARCGAPFAIIAPAVDAAVCAARLAARTGDASEATPAILAQQLEWWEAPEAMELTEPALAQSAIS